MKRILSDLQKYSIGESGKVKSQILIYATYVQGVPKKNAALALWSKIFKNEAIQTCEESKQGFLGMPKITRLLSGT